MQNPYQTTASNDSLDRPEEYLPSSRNKRSSYFVCCLFGTATSLLTLIFCFSDQIPTPLGLTVGFFFGFLIGIVVGTLVVFLAAQTKLPVGFWYLITVVLAWLSTLMSVVALSIVFFAAPKEILESFFKI